jgi:hypothetical protein
MSRLSIMFYFCCKREVNDVWLFEERRVTGIPFCLELREGLTMSCGGARAASRVSSIIRTSSFTSVQIDGRPSRRSINVAFCEILCASSHVQRNTATFRASFEFHGYMYRR